MTPNRLWFTCGLLAQRSDLRRAGAGCRDEHRWLNPFLRGGWPGSRPLPGHPV